MSLKETSDIITAIGAVIAAIASVWGLRIQLNAKKDSFRISLGSISPSIEQETILSIVNISEHAIKLTDYGFIDADGCFESFPFSLDSGELRNEEIVQRGSANLTKRGEVLEIGYIRKISPAGGYAVSATQKYPQVHFSYNLNLVSRLKLRIKILMKGKRYLA